MIDIEDILKKINEHNLYDIDNYKNYYNDKIKPLYGAAIDKGANWKEFRKNGDPTSYVIHLTVFALFPNEEIHKDVFQEVVKSFEPYLKVEKNFGKDAQQGRHLSNNAGFNIANGPEVNNRGCYKLINFDISPKFAFAPHKRQDTTSSGHWEKLKLPGCAMCGAKEGEIVRGRITVLQKGHRDPRKELSNENLIALCEYHNRYYSNHGKQPLYDSRDMIIGFIDSKTMEPCL